MIRRVTIREIQYDAYGQASCKNLCIVNKEIEDFVTVGVINRYITSHRRLTN